MAAPSYLDAFDLADMALDIANLLGDESATELVTLVHADASDHQAYSAFAGSVTFVATTESVRAIIGKRRDSAPVDATVGRYRVLIEAAGLSSAPDTSDTLLRASGEVLQVNAVNVDPVAGTCYVLEVSTVER